MKTYKNLKQLLGILLNLNISSVKDKHYEALSKAIDSHKPSKSRGVTVKDILSHVYSYAYAHGKGGRINLGLRTFEKDRALVAINKLIKKDIKKYENRIKELEDEILSMYQNAAGSSL